MNMIEAVGYPRINWSLIDMAGASKRMYGSFGLAIKYNPIIVTASKSDRMSIKINGDVENRTVMNLSKAIMKAQCKGLPVCCDLEITSNVKQHTGFGSSTQIILTSLDAISELYEWKILPREILDISGRGRTTLIGFMTHYYGGFCIDGGQPFSIEKGYFSSHTPGSRKPALAIGNWRFPEDWKVSLVGENLPLTIQPNEEDSWIQSNTPTEKDMAIRAIVELYSGVLPAVIEREYSTFSKSMYQIQTEGWNSIVLQCQPRMIRKVIASYWDKGYAASISSLGPLITVVHNRDSAEEVRKIAFEHCLSYSGPHDIAQYKTACI